MGKKSKKHGNRPSVDDTFLFAQRAMQKQDFKEALKNAKVCFRQDPTHEHRQLLERSWLARGLQLARAGLQAEGRAAAQELLALGVLQPDVQQGLPELLLAVGLYDQAAASGKVGYPLGGGAQAADPAVLVRAADRAVADPASAPASLAGIREGAAMVRAALDALSAGDENAALAALGDIPRNSPFAEWKLFVRGLAAYYRHDDEAMRANWDRLAPDRFAVRLAAPLRRLADTAGPGSNGIASLADHGYMVPAAGFHGGASKPDAQARSSCSASAAGTPEEFRQAMRVLENDLCGGPVVWYLESLQKSLRAGHWRKAVFRVRRWKMACQAALPGLARRLDRLFYDLAVRKANSKWLADLATAFDPPPWDPRWNRARALIAEEETNYIEPVDESWRAYIEDLASMPDLKPGERTLAQAMVWEQLGRNWANVVKDGDEDDEYDEDKVSARDRTIECFHEAISLSPDFSAAYHALASNYCKWGEEEAAAEVERRLLAQIPDNLDAIISLFRYHRRRDELAARDYALQAYRLKPASDEVLKMVVTGHFLAARALTLQGRWDETRAELGAAAAVGQAAVGSACDVTVRRAMVEFKAGQPAAGWRWLEQALGEGDDPADVYMAAAIEAHRYDLPFVLDGPAQQFWDRWQSSMTKRRGRAAGAMSRRIWAFMQEDNAISGRYAFLNDYLERVVKYVSGCSRIRWQTGDLVNVCRFLDQVVVDTQHREVRGPLVKFLDKGRKKFPQEPEFHFTRGMVEMRRGPSSCNRRLARECLHSAIETAKTSPHPRAKEIQEVAVQQMRRLERADGARPQAREPEAAADFAGVPPEVFSGRGPRDVIRDLIRRIFALGGPDRREDVIEMIKQACVSTGRDPEEFFDEILDDLAADAATQGKE